jgi:mono/diheme cytochrome c family protein
LKPLFPLCLPLALAACQALPAENSSASTTRLRGQALAQASCSGCHAVGHTGTSPNRNAPSFASIANQQGLTSETLSSWLRDAHNYPGEMQFELDQREVDDLVAYMVTLRDPNYRPPI